MNTILLSLSDWLGFSGNIIGAAVGAVGAYVVARWQSKHDRQNSMDSAVYVEVYKELNKMDKDLVQFIQYNFVIKQMLLSISFHKEEILSPNMIGDRYFKKSDETSYITLPKAIDNINKNSNVLINNLKEMINSSETFSLDSYGNFTKELVDTCNVVTEVFNQIYFLDSYYGGTSFNYYANYPPAVKNIDELIDKNDLVNDRLNELRKTIKVGKIKAKK